MKPVVEKYGGTSVGNIERVRAVAERVAQTYRAGRRKLAVVVSAQAGETNRLLNLLQQVSPNPPAEAYDMALASGEQVSVALLSAALSDIGIGAVPLLGYQLGIKTTGLHTKARIQSIDRAKMESVWEQGKIAVVAGFQGINDRQEITTLGRGGSDTSAVALAVAVGAEYCEINTDVAGVFTADPRMVAGARVIDRLDYEVALEMASLGSKVLHPRCVELGKKWSMPIWVRSSFVTDEKKGTKIMSFSEQEALEAPVVSAVTLDKDVSKVTLKGLKLGSDAIEKVFRVVAQNEVNVDIIVYDRPSDIENSELGFTIQTQDVGAVSKALSKLKDEDYPTLGWSVESDLAKVSVVGVGMRSHSGVATRTFAAIAACDIPIEMVSTSEIKISCVIALGEASRAVESLHSHFFGA